MSVTFINGALAAIAAAATITKTASAQNTAGGTAPTHSGVSIGAASADRYIVVCWTAAGLTFSDFSSATIDGNALTSIIAAENGVVGAGILMSSAPVSAGTTAEFILNFTGGGCSACGISVFALTGLLSATPIATDSETADATDMMIGVTVDGVAIGVAAFSAAFGSTTFAFTGLTEDVDEAVENNNLYQGAGSSVIQGTGTLTVNIDSATGFGGTLQFACASWR